MRPMLSLRFYRMSDGDWMACLIETVAGAAIYLWSSDYPTYKDAVIAASKKVEEYDRQASTTPRPKQTKSASKKEATKKKKE